MVEFQNIPGDLSSVNSRGQNVIDKQRENIERIEAREKSEQKRLLSRHKNRASEAERGRPSVHGYEPTYNSNHYLAREANKHSYSLDSSHKPSVSVGQRYQLAAIEQPSKHLAAIKSGSYGQQGPRFNYKKGYDRSMPVENKNYNKHLQPAQLRLETVSHSESQRNLALGQSSHQNS